MSSGERKRIAKLLEPAYRGEAVALPKGTSIDSHIFCEHVTETVEHSNNSGRPALRWIIHNAIFIEHLDLSDGRTGGGSSLPAIEFHNCEFRAGFCASAAQIERLCFDSCEFTASDQQANVINLRNVRILTELCFENLRPHAAENAENEPGLLWVDAFAATIGANVVLKRTILRAPRNESSSLGHDARYALDLATTTIGSDLLMQSAVVLDGGLKVRDARIGGSLWGQGLHVTDGETEETRKAILDRGERPRWGIFGQSVVVKGVLSFSSDWHRRTEGQIPASLANIESDDRSPDPMRFWCMGDVNFLGAHVGDQLDLGGAQVQGNLWLNGAEIAGSCSALKVVTPLVFQRLRAKNPWTFSLEVRTFSMESCHIGADCVVDVDAQELRLDGSAIEGKLAISGKAAKISAAGQTVHGDTKVTLTGIRKYNLGGAKLKGTLDLRESEFAGGLLSIRDAEIGHSLKLAALYQKVHSVRRRPIVCYPDYILSEVALPPDSDENALLQESDELKTRVASFLTRKSNLRGPSDPTRVVLLNGRSAPFHLLNENGFLQLRTEEQAKEYLRLFCAFTWAREGSFSLVEQDSQLPFRFRGKVPVDPLRPINEKFSTDAKFAFEVHIRYGLSLRKVKFALPDSGIPKMGDDMYVAVDNELVAYLPDEVPEYLYPFRVVAGTAFSEFISDAKVADGRDAKRDFLAEVPDWSERLVQDRLDGTDVDLRDTTCGILYDNAGRIWKKSKAVRLEGFSYAGTFMPKESSVEGEVDTRRFWLRGKPYRRRRQQAWEAVVRFLYVVGILQLADKITPRKFNVTPRPENPFRAQPYTQLARVLRERGDDKAARDVEADSMYWGAYAQARKSWRGWFSFVFWWSPYGLFFRFGLAPIRAFFTLLLVWFIGFAAISMLSESKMLNANITAVASVAHGPAAVVPSATKDYVKSLPCGEAIAPALYAAELLTPIFNLHQESRCDIASSRSTTTPLTLWGRPFPHPKWIEEPHLWEYLKAVYIVLGSIVSSLALLTFSGIARRWEH